MGYSEVQSETAVNHRIEEMAAEIISRYQGKNPLFVCLLRGGVPFTSKLLSALTSQAADFHPELDYMTIKSYGKNNASKPPRLVMDLDPDTVVTGRSVIVLDDILDEGHTVNFVASLLKSRGALEVNAVVLVQKQKKRSANMTAGLFGFEVSDKWIVGMGMDDPRIAKEAYRWTRTIGFVAED